MALNFLNDGYFAGKVGIGTDVPGSNLDIKSAMGISGEFSAAQLRLDSTTTLDTTGFQGIRFATSTTVNYGWTIGANRSSNGRGSFRFFEHNNSLVGTERFTLQQDGNVGIGTASPTFKLHVNSTDASDNVAYIHHNNAAQSSGDVLKVRSDAGDNAGSALLNVENNTGSALYVRGDRNVGIGTTSPIMKLQVVGDIYANNGNVFIDSGRKLVWGNSAQWIEATNSTSMEFSGGGSSVDMILLANGNVGIGTTSPDDKLHVNQGSAAFRGITIEGTSPALYLKDTQATNAYHIGSNGNYLYFLEDSNQSGGYNNIMAFWDPSNNFIFSLGNVGIGTSTPSQKLHVAGNLRVTGTYYDSNNTPGTSGQILSSTATGTDWIDGSAIPGVPAGSGTLNTVAMWTPDGDTLGDSPITVSGNDSTFGGSITAPDFRGTAQVYLTSPDSWLFRSTGGSERMRLSSAGNLGINTTNPVYKLDVNGDARSTHFRDGTKGSGSTPATIGWYKVASWTGGSARGGSEIKLSTTGGSFTPITWIIRCYKNWSGDATLKLEQYGYSNIYFTKARVEYDNTAAVYYLEIYQSIAAALSFNMYQTSLMGYDSNVSILTGALAAGTTGGTTRTELPFIAGGTSVEALTIGNSGNTGPFLPLAGGTMTGTNGVLFPDNFKLNIGTGSDLQIYHDGSNSFIEDVGTGSLLLKSNGAGIYLKGFTSTDTYAQFLEGGAVNLYYDNVKKLETTSTGVTVTGDIKIDSALLSNQENTDVDTGTETVASVAIATYTAAFFDFVIKKTTNVRSGTVYACHDGTNVEFTETSTQDLGDTSDVTLSVDISGGNMRLLATVTSDDWSVKSLIRAI